MKILNRYILGELLKVFSLAAVGISLFLYMDKYFLMAEMLVNNGVSFLQIVLLMMYISPAYLAITIPMSVLIAVLIVCNQLSIHNEWTAMKIGHWSFWRLLTPIIYFSFSTYLLTSAIVFFALPWGNQSYKKLVHDIVENRVHVDIKPTVFNRNMKNLILLVNKKKENSLFNGIFIADYRNPSITNIISAEKGVLMPAAVTRKMRIQLENGTLHQLNNEIDHYQTVRFTGYNLTLDLPDRGEWSKKTLAGSREMSANQLRQRINEFKKRGLKVSGLAVELSKKFSIPFTCLLFGFLGIPLGIKTRSSGKSGSFFLGLCVIFTYYFALIGTQNLGRLEVINPYISVWIPNIILGIAALFLGYKLRRGNI